MNRFFLIFILCTLWISNSFALSGKIERWRLENGTRIVFHQTMQVPMVDIEIAFAAGSAYDGQDYGLGELTASLIDEGNGRYSANQIADAFAKTGAQFQAEATRDMAVLHLRSLSATHQLNSAIETLKLVVNEPNFNQSDVMRQKKLILMGIKQNNESPDEVANNLLFRKLYPHHPYGHAVEGTAETVSSLGPQKIRKFYERYWTGQNAVMVIVGALSAEQAHNIAQQVMGNLPAGQKAPPIPKAQALVSAETVRQPFPASQTVIRLGQIGITHNDPDFFSLLVGNYILGGGTLVSRLGLEVREIRGLSYGVNSRFIPMPGIGPFIIGLSTKTNQTKEAVAVTKDTLSRFLTDGPTTEEVLAAKQYLTGNFNVSLSSNNAMANTLLRIAFYDLPEDYLEHYIHNIEQVDIKDIKRAFDKIINPKKMLLVEVGQTE